MATQNPVVIDTTESSSSTSTKHDQMLSRLQKSDEERNAHLKQMKEKRLEVGAVLFRNTGLQVKLNEFHQLFNQQRQFLEGLLSQSSKIPKNEISSHLTTCSESLSSLTSTMNSASHYLPASDKRLLNSQLKKLNVQLDEQIDTLIPKQKFRFTKRDNIKSRNGKVNENFTASESTTIIQNKLLTQLNAKDPNTGFESIQNQTLCKTSTKLNEKDVWLLNIDNCNVYFIAKMTAARLTQIRNSTIVVCSVAGSVLIHHCENSIFYLSSRQVRIHHTNNCTFYLHVKSNPIIEHSTNCQFAPFELDLHKKDELLKQTQLLDIDNLYDRVEDFNWLKTQKSPNWSILPQSDWKTFKIEHSEFVES